MTWEQFIASEYNVDNKFFISEGSVLYGGMYQFVQLAGYNTGISAEVLNGVTYELK